jgi:hypothetical protein
MQPAPAKPVKYFIGALFSDEDRLIRAISQAENIFNSVDHVSEDFPFRITKYYDDEMGTPIFRRFVSFSRLLDPGFLCEAKILTNHIEDSLRISEKRKVNLDVGYLDNDKVVLASAKYGIHKVFLAQGIYADLALHYSKGQFQPYEWAFPDFKRPDYTPFFLRMREIYKRQSKRVG